eukprot:768058-Hanusia_phi.AAC.6
MTCCSSFGVTWNPRRVCLCADRILIGKPGEDDIVDFIPLDEIESVAVRSDKLSRVDSKSRHRIASLKMVDVSARSVMTSCRDKSVQGRAGRKDFCDKDKTRRPKLRETNSLTG